MTERWWTGITRAQWLILLVAWLGWVFDIADVALYNFAKGPMLNEFLLGDKAQIARVDGLLITVFLVGWAVGGLLFGVLADRWGRARTMVVTILIYALFTGLTALCKTWEQVAVVRFVTALGIGGEWAAGAALVAEAFPDKSRAAAATLLQSAAAFGPVFAAIVNLQIAPDNWRWLFLVGVFPAIVTVFVRLWVRETGRAPASFDGAQDDGALVREDKRVILGSAEGSERKKGDVLELFSDPTLRRNALIALVLGVVVIAGAGNVSNWLPNLVEQASQGLDPAVVQARKSTATMILHIGTLVGVILMPFACERIGRKRALALFMVLSPVSVYAATQATGTWGGLLLAAPLMSLFTIGMSAGLVLYFPELFPARLRATGSGIAYNVSRFIAAGIPLLTTYWMGKDFSIAKGVATTAIVLGLGVLVLPFATETRGKALEA